MSTSRIRACIFDMDGTLLDSMRYWRRMHFDFLRDHGLSVPEDLREALPFMSTERSSGLFAERFGHLGLTRADILEEYRQRMILCYAAEVAETPGASAFLGHLRAQGIPFCIATMTQMDMALPALERHGLTEGSAFALCTHDLGLSKTDPACFEAIAARLGVEPSDCAVFEDALYAMEGAHRAGCAVYGIADVYSAPERAGIEAICQAYVADFDALMASPHMGRFV